MNLRTRIRPFSDAALIEGTLTDQDRAEHERQVRQARLELARRETHWTEIAPAERLVRRGPLFVDSETDLVWVVRRGHIWEPGRASVGYLPDNTPMTYFVDQLGEVVFLEAPGGMPRTWSEVVARQAARE